MLSVLGVVVTFCVGVCTVHLQSGLYCGCLYVRNSDEPSVWCVCLHLIEVCFLFVTEVTNPNYWSVFVCVSRWARI